MKVFILVLISTYSFGQVSFEKGYFINNNNLKSECLIKNVDWKANPAEFLYKLEGDNEIRKGDLASVKEFGIYENSRFKRASVKIDKSKTSTGDLDYNRNPVWSQETLFLKVLIDAKASLYSYEDGNLELFFYSAGDSIAHQLVYKKYLIRGSSDNDMINTNNDFRQELSSHVSCKTATDNSLTKINYNSKDLLKYFIRYNHCEGGTIAVAEAKVKRQVFNFKVTPGFNYSSVNLVHAYYPDINFDKTINIRLGFEIEVTLTPKTSFVWEPTYQVLNTQKEEAGKINYRFMDFPIGFRYNFFLTKTSKVFLNGFYVPSITLDFTSNPVITYSQVAVGWSQPTPGSISIKNRDSFAVGLGIDQNRITLEARFYTPRNITSNDINSASDYRRLAFIFGYKVFKRGTK